jgi:hypothetical protein
MRRRNLTGATIGIAANALLPRIVRAAQPCPPPLVSTAVGTSASMPCSAAASNTYSTDFAGSENPISEGGRWVNGKSSGLAWNNVQTATGKAHGAAFVGLGGSRYDDCIAHLNTAFTANQYAQGTVSRVPGYRNASDKHEVELLLRFQITTNSARGYEVLWGQDGEISIVRWNGPLGNYKALAALPDSRRNMAVEGDVLRAEVVGSVINVFRNGRVVLRAEDSTYTSGQPGLGFWPLPGSTLSSYGWKAYSAGSL